MIHVFKNLFTIHKHNYCKCAVYATLVGYDPWIVNYRCKSIIYQHNCYIPVLIIHVYMDFMSPLVFFNLKEQQIQLLFLFQACYVNETIVIVAALIIHVYMDFMCYKHNISCVSCNLMRSKLLKAYRSLVIRNIQVYNLLFQAI